MCARAMSWAVGYIDALVALPFHNQYVDCLNAITETGPARRLGMDDLHERVDGAWMEAAEDALANNAVTFATLPMTQPVSDTGYVTRLRAKGSAVSTEERRVGKECVRTCRSRGTT